MSNKLTYASIIKTEAKRLGFLSCGISKAEFLEDEAPRLEAWLSQNKHGKMQYMENNCLLYTSPSPRDATLSRMPSSA